MVEAHCQKVDVFTPKDSNLDSLTFEAYLRQSGADDVAVSTAAIWTRAMLGQEPGSISALYFLNYCKSGGGLLQMRSDRKHGGQYLRVRQGTQFFSKKMAKSLPPGTVRFSSPIQSVRHIPGGVEVKSSRETVHARKVIISVPTPVLKTISFEPRLPDAKTILTESFSYGYYTKVMVVFKEAFWINNGYCGLAQSFSGPVSVIRDTSIPADNKWVLTCFLVGDPGFRWSQLSADQQKDTLLNQIGQLYADRGTVDRNFSEMVGHEWTTEEYSGWGCPCTSLPPGVLDTVGDSLREPVGDVHFVGTETAGEWKGYMEGALRSGERGAAEVINLLSQTTSKL
jgi:monoamine oxidase